MKKLARLALPIALLSSLFLVIPGASAATVAGEVGGVVRYVNGTGLKLDGSCTPQTYAFDDVVLNGAVRLNTGLTYAGNINTDNVYGSANGCETTGGGNGLGVPATGVVASASNPARIVATTTNSQTITGTFYGTYERRDTVVTVDLTATITISGPAGSSTETLPIKVRAQFTPQGIDTVQGKITSASFVGQFSSN